MLKLLTFDSHRIPDAINIVAGLGLAVSPWYLDFAAETGAAWNAWIVGAAVTLIGLVALFAFHRTEDWANAALGLWAIAAPWVLGFSALRGALIAHVVAGLVLAIVAAGRLWYGTSHPYSTA